MAAFRQVDDFFSLGFRSGAGQIKPPQGDVRPDRGGLLTPICTATKQKGVSTDTDGNGLRVRTNPY
jgi:hypothetical protein